MELDAARAQDRNRVLRADPRPLAFAHEQSRERRHAAGGARSEPLELYAAAVSVPGITLALLTPALGIARQTLHESLTRKSTRSSTPS
jgi:hypothetical protein